MIERYVLVWLTLVSAIAYFVPAPFVATQPYLNYVIATVMFFVGTLLRTEEFAGVMKRWPTVIGGVALQYTSMPLLGYFAAKLFGLPLGLTIGVVMTGVVPGAMASTAITLLAKGNVSYSVAMTTLATVLAPFMIPAWLLFFFGAGIELSAGQMMTSLILTVAAPVFLGWLTGRYCPAFRAWCEIWGPAAANIAILWIVGVVVAANGERLGVLALSVLPALVALNFGGYLAGWYGGPLLGVDEGMRRALVLEIGMQNAGLGTVLVMKWFPQHPEAAVPTALYTFGCILTGAALAQYWRSRPLDGASETTPAAESVVDIPSPIVERNESS